MLTRLLIALPLSLLFMTVSDQWSIQGFVLGYAIGFGVMLLIGDIPGETNVVRLPSQLFWLTRYVLRLAWDILLSGFDVARRVLDPRLPINPGELLVSTQDDTQNIILSALSAHSITVTPGEMVEDSVTHDVGLQELDGTPTGGGGRKRKNQPLFMVVHTLDIDESNSRADREQAQRMRLLRRFVLDTEPTKTKSDTKSEA